MCCSVTFGIVRFNHWLYPDLPRTHWGPETRRSLNFPDWLCIPRWWMNIPWGLNHATLGTGLPINMQVNVTRSPGSVWMTCVVCTVGLQLRSERASSQLSPLEHLVTSPVSKFNNCKKQWTDQVLNWIKTSLFAILLKTQYDTGVVILPGTIFIIQQRIEEVIFVNAASVEPHRPAVTLKLDTAISIHLQDQTDFLFRQTGI